MQIAKVKMGLIPKSQSCSNGYAFIKIQGGASLASWPQDTAGESHC